ncbi:MAG: hypothetical protein LC733_03885 [Actinobacteria bacterium]|nr:hypothetical protein [Actinomycetota bacterium]
MSVEDIENVEEVEDASEAISKEEGRGSLALWFGVLGSPLAWFGHLGANYSLEEWFACSNSAKERGEILGLGVDIVSILINTAMVAVAMASGLAAWSCWRKLRGADADDADGGGDVDVDVDVDNEDGSEEDRLQEERTERARWMAFAGIVEGALFLGIILLGYLPALTLGICETTP